VIAIAGILSATAFLYRSEISAAPSSKENYVWTWRWLKEGIFHLKLGDKDSHFKIGFPA